MKYTPGEPDSGLFSSYIDCFLHAKVQYSGWPKKVVICMKLVIIYHGVFIHVHLFEYRYSHLQTWRRLKIDT